MRFNHARLKINRANEHILDVDKRLDRVPKSHVATTEINPAVGNKVIKHDLSDPDFLTDIALMVGDAVHNFKCALDYAWLETITRLAPDAISRHGKFPIYQTANALKNALTGIKIDTTSPALFDLMMSKIQPYEAGNIAIWPIHRLDIRDKHRLLIPFVGYGGVTNIELQHKSGEIVKGNTWGTSQPLPYFIPIEDGWEIKNKGEFSLSVMFDPAETGREFRALDSLMFYSDEIIRVVEMMEEIV